MYRHHHFALGGRERDSENERKNLLTPSESRPLISSSFIGIKEMRVRWKARTLAPDESDQKKKKRKKRGKATRPSAISLTGRSSRAARDHLYCEEQNSSRTNILT